jgi:hypothetical protein
VESWPHTADCIALSSIPFSHKVQGKGVWKVSLFSIASRLNSHPFPVSSSTAIASTAKPSCTVQDSLCICSASAKKGKRLNVRPLKPPHRCAIRHSFRAGQFVRFQRCTFMYSSVGMAQGSMRIQSSPETEEMDGESPTSCTTSSESSTTSSESDEGISRLQRINSLILVRKIS